jgi:CubicO group peptidase (beta-lactamase class C family)
MIMILAMSLASCDKMFLGEDEPIIGLDENLQSPPALGDGWDVADLASQDVDAQSIQRLVSFIQEKPSNIHSLVIVRNNKLVLESYFTGWHRNRVHALRSVSKTFMSTLVGIAVDKGHFSVDQKVSDLLPEHAALTSGKNKQIEVRHLLTMTSGIKWDEKTFSGGDLRNDETAFDRSDQRLTYLFENEMAALPGSEFEYNSALPVVESAIIKQATGIHAHVFADEHLFKPLGITDYFWRTDPNDGYVTAIGPLFLRSRDMAKLGQLFLDSGTWKGQRIISKQWVKDATTTFTGDETTGDGYGYHWWTARYNISGKEIRTFYARGSGGQYIFVVPEFDVVVVFTSGNYSPLNQSAPVGMLTNVILPAMK